MKGDEENLPSSVIPLRTILRNFINLVENCETGRLTGIDIYEKEFHELKSYSENLKCDPDYQSKEGEKSVNRKKNRYKDILPFDYTRVILADYGDIPGSDYINANFIKGASGSSAYIACQGPLAHTVNDFWRMVVECEVQVVVMACTELESGKHKCENYWVEEDGVEKQFGQVTVWLKKCRNVCPDFLVRTMRIRYPNAKGEMDERNVCQFHYSAWPDHGVPNKVRPLLDMVRLIRDCQTSETLPVLVHCSAGCGRTGTICAIDYVWGLLRLGKLTPDFSLFHLVRDMRRQRIAMVQTKDQYILAHRALKELFQDQLKIIEAHPYANVDENGLPFDIKQDLEEPTYETIEFDGSGAHISQNLIAIGDCNSENTQASVISKSGAPTSRSKLKKEVENRKEKQKEQHVEKVSASRPPEPMPHGMNRIQTDTIETYDCTDSRAVQSKGTSSTSSSSGVTPVRSSLLRKPSMVKLKAFFDKTPKDESKEAKSHSSTSKLSRAKSDVSSSSRFYSFASAFGGSRGHLSSGTSNGSNEPVLLKSAARSESPVRDKGSSGKPPILAKPSLPIKRSKSLKVHPAETFVQPAKKTTYKIGNGAKRSDNGKIDGLQSKLSSPSSSGFSAVSNNPIKVCVKQADIPKLQSIVTSEMRTTQLHDFTEDNTGDSSGRNEIDMLRGLPSSSFAPTRDSHNYVNVTYGNNRIKMGIAKEMEDISDFGSSRRNPKFGKIKKYDTVNPRSLIGSTFGQNGEATGTTLTRSQSHVWQPEKVQLSQLDRIFSDENIHHKSIRTTSDRNEAHPETTQERFAFRNFTDTGNRMPQPSTLLNLGLDQATSSNVHHSKSSFLGEPSTRRRVPKTNPFIKFPSSRVEQHSPAFLRVSQRQGDGIQVNPHDRLNGANEYIPQLTGCYNGKSNGVRSTGNSSDSSSSTGTPKTSLPGTPTESIDVLCQRIANSNGPNNDGTSPKLQRTFYNGGTPKSILKGSLSSTPSESEERLNNGCVNRGLGLPMTSNLGPMSQSPLSAMRVGIRERRNSFRQAVWKEAAQNDTQSNPPHVEYSSSVLAGQHQAPPLKPHKDYEHIWPDDSSPRTFQTVLALNERGSPPVNAGAPRQNGGTSIQSISIRPLDNTEKTNSNPPYQSRMDEIKILLQELKTPIGINEPNSNRQQPSNNLKYHRSLKAPTRAQYQESNQNGNSLSCFTLRKPSSLESITDQLHLESQAMEEHQAVKVTQQARRQYPLQSRGQYENLHSGAGAHSSGSYAQDYVQLCRRNNSSQGCFEIEGQDDFGVMKRTPIPPPRTKAKRTTQPSSSIELRETLTKPNASVDIGGGSRSGGLSLWTGKATCSQNREDANSREAKGEEPLQQQRSNGAIVTTSPKALIRAIGLFQAKAANVKSRFANWADTKDKSNHQSRRPHGSTSSDTSLILKDNDDDQQDDSGFASPRRTSNSSQIGPTRATKHQYL